jgi:nicotinate dehydrogenase subunit B
MPCCCRAPSAAPVRVQLTREQEQLWEPKGAAQLMQVRGGLDGAGRPQAYDFTTSYPSNAAPTLALLLTRTIDPVAQAFEMGDRTAVPPYAFAAPSCHRQRHGAHPARLLAAWRVGPAQQLRARVLDRRAGAHAAGADPVDYRLCAC